MAKVPIALELYSVREDLTRDPRGTLKAVAEMGYDGAEFAGFPLPAAELRAVLDDVGLPCCSSHTPLDHLIGDRLQETIEFNQVLGNKNLICPWIGGDYAGSRAGWLRAAELFNGIADKLAPHGMVTGYHNHHTEFTPVDGETPWDTFFGNTKKEVVMQLDLGNALMGGADLLGILGRFPGRGRSIHLKPYSKKAGAGNPEAGFRPLIGDDDVPWAEVFRLCEETQGTRCYIVEYESDAFAPLDAVDRCLKALRAMGK
ncbi:MAG: sugar phosphate isomerase/epimerase [Chthonomonadales bacterium]|nr:sugar phosphate isomerase/epimerase [Chthonomonadales bacterium]